MSLLLLGGIEFKNKVISKLKIETGLEGNLLLLYDAFVLVSHPVGAIVQPGDVKYNVQEFLILSEGKSLEEHWDEYTGYVDTLYDVAVKAFEERRLITNYTLSDGKVFPKVIGYNYFEDPEFFIAYRKIGEKDWTGRIAAPLTWQEFILYKNKDYEFREKEIENSFLN